MSHFGDPDDNLGAAFLVGAVVFGVIVWGVYSVMNWLGY